MGIEMREREREKQAQQTTERGGRTISVYGNLRSGKGHGN